MTTAQLVNLTTTTQPPRSKISLHRRVKNNQNKTLFCNSMWARLACTRYKRPHTQTQELSSVVRNGKDRVFKQHSDSDNENPSYRNPRGAARACKNTTEIHVLLFNRRHQNFVVKTQALWTAAVDEHNLQVLRELLPPKVHTH